MSSDVQTRRRPRPWRDVRFFVGLVLVAASVAGVWLVIAAARQTQPAVVAVRALLPGDQVTTADLRIVEVALGSVDGYLLPGDLPADAVAMRTVEAGELLPRSALVSASEAQSTRVVVESTVGVPATVTPGSAVDIWAAEEDGDSGYLAPTVIVAAAVVAMVRENDGVVASQGSSIELVVARDDVPAVLSAVASGARVSVIPVGAAE